MRSGAAARDTASMLAESRRQTTATSFWNRRAAGSAEMIDFFFLVPIGLGLAGRPREAKKMCPERAQRPFCSSRVLDRLPLKVIETATCGRVAEWFKAPVLKTGVPARAPWVRIPPLPPVCFFAGQDAPAILLGMNDEVVGLPASGHDVFQEHAGVVGAIQRE